MPTRPPTPTSDRRESIRDALAADGAGPFDQAAIGLLACLGYTSDRTLPGQSGDPGDLFERFPAPNPGTATEAELREHARSIRVLFQITDQEIAASAHTFVFDAPFDGGLNKSYLFIAIEWACPGLVDS